MGYFATYIIIGFICMLGFRFFFFDHDELDDYGAHIAIVVTWPAVLVMMLFGLGITIYESIKDLVSNENNDQRN